MEHLNSNKPSFFSVVILSWIKKVLRSPKFYLLIFLGTTIIIFLGVIIFKTDDFSKAMINLSDFMMFHPVSGFFIFYGIEIAFIILCLPGLWLSLFSGIIFTKGLGFLSGLIIGTTVTSLAQITVALICFPFSRFLINNCIRKISNQNNSMKEIETALEKQGLKLSILLRFNLLFPSFILNYWCPITTMTFFQYLIGLFAMIPGELFINFIGSCFDNLTEGKNGSNSFNFPDIGLVQGIILFLSIFLEICLTIFSIYLINEEIKNSKSTTTLPTSRGFSQPEITNNNNQIPHLDEDCKSAPKELKIISVLNKEENINKQ